MKCTAWLTLLAAATLTACDRATPEQQIVNDAAAALGGRERILAVKTIVIEGKGTAYSVGSDRLIDTNYRVYDVAGYRYAIDVAGRRALSEQTRTPLTPNFSGQAPVKQVQGIDGDVGYNIGSNGNATRVRNKVTIDARRADIYHHPLTSVRAAIDPAAKVANLRTLGNETIVDITTADAVSMTLAIDSTTKLPTRVVSTTASDNILGDVAAETAFADYQDVSGLRLPAHFTSKVDRFKDTDIRVTKQTIDGDIGNVGNLAAPAAAASAPATEAPAPPVTVTVEEVAKGIWFLAGQTHHSVLVEFGDHLTLIEAPNEARALAVFAKAKELRPNKPLTVLVNTHHHFDHSAGVRAAVSEGLTVITHRSNVAFYEEAVQRPHRLIPDALSKNPTPKPLKIVAVDDEMVLKDDTRTIVLCRILNNSHADNNLMVYFPGERLLTQADIFMPRDPRTLGYAPWVDNLLENIKTYHLQIDRMMPLHGKIVPYREFLQVAKDGFDRAIVPEAPPYRFTAPS